MSSLLVWAWCTAILMNKTALGAKNLNSIATSPRALNLLRALQTGRQRLLQLGYYSMGAVAAASNGLVYVALIIAGQKCDATYGQDSIQKTELFIFWMVYQLLLTIHTAGGNLFMVINMHLTG